MVLLHSTCLLTNEESVVVVSIGIGQHLNLVENGDGYTDQQANKEGLVQPIVVESKLGYELGHLGNFCFR